MRFLGFIVGLVIGAAVEDFEGALYGAAFGLLAGYAFQLLRGKGAETRIARLEQEVTALRSMLESLRAQQARQQQARAAAAPPPAADVPQPAVAPAPLPQPALATPESERVPARLAAMGEAEAAAAEPARQPARPARPASSDPPAWLRWLLGGNTVVRVGVVVLFFGVAFLLKYAYDHTNVPIQVRLLGVAIGAIVMLTLGWRLRRRMPGYALALQGGAIGVLYLTVFASFRLFGLLPSSAALVLLFLIAALSAALAVLQNSQSLAILGASGGFLAPVLASTGSGSHVMLFSYYAMLNAGILAIAWFKSWRPLNLVGFVFTFGIGGLWGADAYRADLYASTQPFLVLFFLMYLAIPVLFAGREANRTDRYLDTTLVFGVPIVAFGMQLRLMRELEFGAAWSALVLGLIYLGLARWLFRRNPALLRMLVEAFLALGIVFATLAIPLALDGRWTAAAWALEGAAVLWIGVRQRRRLARAFGMLLQLGAGIAFLSAGTEYRDVPLFNSFYLGCVFIALAGLFSNWWLERNRTSLTAWEPAAAIALFVWGVLWWLAGGLTEIGRQASQRVESDYTLLFFTASAVAFAFLHLRIDWRLAKFPALALVPLAALVALGDATLLPKPHPLAGLGWLAWPAMFAGHLWLLRRMQAAATTAVDVLHAAGLWLLAALGALEAAWWIHRAVDGEGIWPLIAWVIVPGALLMLLAVRGERLPWPVRTNVRTYLLAGAAPLAAFLWLWVLYANVATNGDPAPLPYVPLVNPLDLAQIAALLTIVWWLREVHRLALFELTSEHVVIAASTLGAAAFVAANGALLRAVHHYAGIPYRLEPLWDSMLVQAALAIFWSLLALATMVVASRTRLRPLWIAGAALMGVVVAKLFVVDLSNVSGVERIVSFIGVGVLMLLIGYLSPVPPRTREAAP
jgi:uncharacterized membrane protein